MSDSEGVRPLVVRPERADVQEQGPVRITYLVESDQVTGWSMVHYTAAPGFAPPPVLHRHTREHASFYVLDGEVEVTFEDRVESLDEGCLLVLPPGCWFRWRNASQERPVSFLSIFSPAGFEQFFREVGAAFREAGGFDPSKMAEILGPLRAKYGDEEHPSGSAGAGSS